MMSGRTAAAHEIYTQRFLRLNGDTTMRNFFDNLKYRFAAFMQGRYGYDELNRALSVLFFAFWILSLITGKRFFYTLGLIALVYSLYRSFSRDHMKRSRERLWYLQQIDKVKRFFRQLKQRWDQRNTHKFFRCKQCGVMIRVPKGKGQVEITCPKCGNKFVDRT